MYLQPTELTKDRKFPWIKPVIPRIGTYNVQGAFMKRQEEVSDVFASVVTEDLITLKSIMTEMYVWQKKTRPVVLSSVILMKLWKHHWCRHLCSCLWVHVNTQNSRRT